MKRVPELYKQYPFFDDGKYSPSRFHVATVVKIMTIEEAKRHNIVLDEQEENDPSRRKMTSLYDIWKEAVEECKSDHIWPHTEDGYWCYAPETDFFIVCAIPDYDESLIYFARHVNGGWFSFETTDPWQCGLLDVDCDTFKCYEEDYPEIYDRYKDIFLHK